MQELKEQFFKIKGTNIIFHFLQKKNYDLSYIALRFLVFLSESIDSEQYLCNDEIIDEVIEFSSKNDQRCIKEGIRFMINLSFMRKETVPKIVVGICRMCKAVIRSNNSNNASLAFLGLKLISQHNKNHLLIIGEDNLFEEIFRLDSHILQQNYKNIIAFFFNLLINDSFQKIILEKKILNLIASLIQGCDEISTSQVQAVLSSLIK